MAGQGPTGGRVEDAPARAAEAKALWDRGERVAARAAQEEAARLAPSDIRIGFDLARMLAELGDLEAAVARYRELARLAPDRAVIHNNLGNACVKLGQVEAALEAYRMAIQCAPDYALAWYNRGKLLRDQGAYDDAHRDLDQAIALSVGLADAHYERSFCHLVDAHYAQGWPDYERRWESPLFLAESATPAARAFRERFQIPDDAAALKGRRVLVVDEQGIGDAVMFASILPDVIAVAAQVTLVCDPRLRRLFSHSFPTLSTHPAGAAIDPARFDIVLPIGSLARLFRSSGEAFPKRPYLAASAAARAEWAARLGPAAGKARIGLSWRGGVARTRRAERSIPLADLAPLLELPDCEFVSLQYGDTRTELDAVNAGLARPIRCLEPGAIDDFDDLAGLVENLDLVVSVQTALVHVSGALGAPCFAMITAAPEWRYLRSGPTMPWYGSVQLFRQGEDRTWPPVIARVAQAVASRLRP